MAQKSREQRSNMSDIDKQITNRVVELTSLTTLENMFGERDSYSIPKSLNISFISKKAFYKLNNDELYYLKVRSTLAYNPLKDYYTKRARRILGFDFNKDFGIKDKGSFNLQSLSQFEMNDIDSVDHIPMKQSLVNKIMSAPKFKINVETHPKSRFIQEYRSAQYYLCEVNKQIVPIVFVERDFPFHNYNGQARSRSVSVYALLQGKTPFFISRLDFEPHNKHTNRLDNGNVTVKKIVSNCTTHQHLYSERFAILVPSKRKVLSCDTVDYGHLKTFEDVRAFVEAQMNVQKEYNPQIEYGFKDESLRKMPTNHHRKHKNKRSRNNTSFDRR